MSSSRSRRRCRLRASSSTTTRRPTARRRALEAGAFVRRELRRGKGNVVCRMFADIDADVYVRPMETEPTSRGCPEDGAAARGREPRHGRGSSNARHRGRRFPRGHVVGNWLFNRLLKTLFGADMTDAWVIASCHAGSSSRSRCASQGFEIETEIATHTVDIGLPYAEVATTYRPRHVESKRKLRTFRDGLRIMLAAGVLLKEMRPLRFFTLIAVTLTVIALVLGVPVVEEYLDTGLVPRLPTAVLSASIQVIAFICLTAGLVLDSVCRMRREAKRLVYLALPAVNPSGAGFPPSDLGVRTNVAGRTRALPKTGSRWTLIGQSRTTTIGRPGCASGIENRQLSLQEVRILLLPPPTNLGCSQN